MRFVLGTKVVTLYLLDTGKILVTGTQEVALGFFNVSGIKTADTIELRKVIPEEHLDEAKNVPIGKPHTEGFVKYCKEQLEKVANNANYPWYSEFRHYDEVKEIINLAEFSADGDKKEAALNVLYPDGWIVGLAPDVKQAELKIKFCF